MSAPCCPPPANDTGCAPPAKAESAACCPPAATPAGTCCPPHNSTVNCGPNVADDRPGYKLWPFVCAWLDCPAGQVPQVATHLTAADITGRWQMRWGLGRSRYSIAPGLYAVGTPSSSSPVLVTANYKMTFDMLRHAHATLKACGGRKI